MNVRVPHDSLLGKGVVKASIFNNGTFTPIAGVRQGDTTLFTFQEKQDGEIRSDAEPTRKSIDENPADGA